MGDGSGFALSAEISPNSTSHPAAGSRLSSPYPAAVRHAGPFRRRKPNPPPQQRRRDRGQRSAGTSVEVRRGQQRHSLERREVHHPVRQAEQRPEEGRHVARRRARPTRPPPPAARARTARTVTPTTHPDPRPAAPESRRAAAAGRVVAVDRVGDPGAEAAGGQHHHDAAHRHGRVAPRPARPRQRGGEQRLEPPARLLGAHLRTAAIAKPVPISAIDSSDTAR